jgi:hypothetical protein
MAFAMSSSRRRDDRRSGEQERSDESRSTRTPGRRVGSPFRPEESRVGSTVEAASATSAGLGRDATTTWRLRQLVRDRLCGRRRLSLAYDHAFAVENADVGLVHRKPREILLIGSRLDLIDLGVRSAHASPDVQKLGFCNRSQFCPAAHPA